MSHLEAAVNLQQGKNLKGGRMKGEGNERK
jgi:hypothetical protein